MIIEYKGKTINTKNYIEITQQEQEELKTQYFEKPSFQEVAAQLQKIASGGSKMDKINRYYFRDLMAKTQIYSAKWTVEDVFNSRELLGMFYAKTLNNKNIFPDNEPKIKHIEKAIHLGGKGYAKIPANYPIKSIREILSKYNINNNFYDFSCGWGARLLGALSMKINYYGVDPNTELINRLFSLINDYKSLININTVTDIRPIGSEIFIPEWTNKMGLAFSSPPYFNLEDYKIGKQSYTPGTTYEQWLCNYLKPTIKNIYQYLISDGIFALNIKNFDKYQLVNDSLNIAQEIGFTKIGIEVLHNIQRTKSTIGKTDNSEGIYIFKK